MEIPESYRESLAPETLLSIVRALATRVEGRRAGVNVARIVQTLMGDAFGSGPAQAALYQDLRDAVRLRIEGMPELVYVTGLS
jgi:hypothetical protein